MQTGWLVENGKEGNELRYRTIHDHGYPAWTEDANKAIRFTRREDAEMFSKEDEDAWRIEEYFWDDENSRARSISSIYQDHTGEIIATLLVNYGPEGRCIPGLIIPQVGVMRQLVKVLTYYDTCLKTAKSDLEDMRKICQEAIDKGKEINEENKKLKEEMQRREDEIEGMIV